MNSYDINVTHRISSQNHVQWITPVVMHNLGTFSAGAEARLMQHDAAFGYRKVTTLQSIAIRTTIDAGRRYLLAAVAHDFATSCD